MLKAIQPVLMSRDVSRSIRFFESLGFAPAFFDSGDSPRYAGIRRDGLELHLQRHDPAEWVDGVDRPTYRFVTEDPVQLHREFCRSGVPDMTEPRRTEWGTEEFHVRDPDGNGLQFYRDAD